jgi:(p)ppGpp synthase/HD superfamily hydrolase
MQSENQASGYCAEDECAEDRIQWNMPQSAKAYSSTLYDAIELAARAHHGQVRKGTEIPYLVHPLAVAGILHDTLEDTPATLEEIRSHFGWEVADLVVALSEPDKQAPWEERKAHTLEYLEQMATPDVLLVAVADKLDNMRAIRAGLASDGAAFWLRFNRPRENQKWYYQRLADVFERRITAGAGVVLAQAFKLDVERVFGENPA